MATKKRWISLFANTKKVWKHRMKHAFLKNSYVYIYIYIYTIRILDLRNRDFLCFRLVSINWLYPLKLTGNFIFPVFDVSFKVTNWSWLVNHRIFVNPTPTKHLLWNTVEFWKNCKLRGAQPTPTNCNVVKQNYLPLTISEIYLIGSQPSPCYNPLFARSLPFPTKNTRLHLFIESYVEFSCWCFPGISRFLGGNMWAEISPRGC